MAKITLDPVTGGYDLSVINNNFDKLETELNSKVMYRNNPVGEPNTWETDLDANSKRLYNLPAPTIASEAARLTDIQGLMNGLGSLVQFTPYKNISSINLQSAIQEEIDDLESTAGAGLIGFIHSGSGATNRTVSTKLKDLFNTADYSTLVQAKTAAGNAPVYDSVGIIHKDTYNNFVNTFQESGETTWKASSVFRSADNTGSHTGIAYSAKQIESRPKGSGANGPSNADYGLTVSLLKQNFDTTAVIGELDGLNIVVRQGGTASDATCWLGNVAHYGTGFAAVFEAQSSDIASNVVQHQIQVQAGAVDNINNGYYGYFVNANVGALTDAYRCDNTGGSSWTNFFRGIKDGIERFKVSSSGDIVIADSSGIKKTITVGSGALRIVNNAGTVDLLTIFDDSSLITTPSSIRAASYNVGVDQVVGTRNTGWVAFTGAGNKNTSYDTATITLQQLAQRVNSIQAALTTHGLIGA